MVLKGLTRFFNVVLQISDDFFLGFVILLYIFGCPFVVDGITIVSVFKLFSGDRLADNSFAHAFF